MFLGPPPCPALGYSLGSTDSRHSLPAQTSPRGGTARNSNAMGGVKSHLPRPQGIRECSLRFLISTVFTNIHQPHVYATADRETQNKGKTQEMEVVSCIAFDIILYSQPAGWKCPRAAPCLEHLKVPFQTPGFH